MLVEVLGISGSSSATNIQGDFSIKKFKAKNMGFGKKRVGWFGL